MFFKHKYLTQPSITPIDTVLRTPDDLYQILKGLPHVKSSTRTAMDMSMDIFKNVGTEDKTEVDKQQTRMGVVATQQTTSDHGEEKGGWIEPDEARLAYGDLQTTKNVQITKSGNNLSHRENCEVSVQEKVNLERKWGQNP